MPSSARRHAIQRCKVWTALNHLLLGSSEGLTSCRHASVELCWDKMDGLVSLVDSILEELLSRIGHPPDLGFLHRQGQLLLFFLQDLKKVQSGDLPATGLICWGSRTDCCRMASTTSSSILFRSDLKMLMVLQNKKLITTLHLQIFEPPSKLRDIFIKFSLTDSSLFLGSSLLPFIS